MLNSVVEWEEIGGVRKVEKREILFGASKKFG